LIVLAASRIACTRAKTAWALEAGGCGAAGAAGGCGCGRGDAVGAADNDGSTTAGDGLPALLATAIGAAALAAGTGEGCTGLAAAGEAAAGVDAIADGACAALTGASCAAGDALAAAGEAGVALAAGDGTGEAFGGGRGSFGLSKTPYAPPNHSTLDGRSDDGLNTAVVVLPSPSCMYEYPGMLVPPATSPPSYALSRLTPPSAAGASAGAGASPRSAAMRWKVRRMSAMRPRATYAVYL
jgi:hypothetical protein